MRRLGRCKRRIRREESLEAPLAQASAQKTSHAGCAKDWTALKDRQKRSAARTPRRAWQRRAWQRRAPRWWPPSAPPRSAAGPQRCLSKFGCRNWCSRNTTPEKSCTCRVPDVFSITSSRFLQVAPAPLGASSARFRHPRALAAPWTHLLGPTGAPNGPRIARAASPTAPRHLHPLLRLRYFATVSATLLFTPSRRCTLLSEASRKSYTDHSVGAYSICFRMCLRISSGRCQSLSCVTTHRKQKTSSGTKRRTWCLIQ